jgi:adenosylhomocysteinase
MDMSFAIQALCARYHADHRGELPVKLMPVPPEIDSMVARMKLETMGVSIDTLTPEQEKYLSSWQI